MTEDCRQSENGPQLQQVKQQPIIRSLTDGNITQNPMPSHPMLSINETETEIEIETETKTETEISAMESEE